MDARNSGRTCGAVALAASILGLGLAACGPGPALDASEAETRQPELAVFVYDRSASISDYQLELAQQLTRQRIAALSHGDRIAAVQVLQLSLDEPPQRWSQDVPKREWEGMDVARDSVTLVRFQRDADAYLRAFTDASNREEIMGTDLLSTFHDVRIDTDASQNVKNFWAEYFKATGANLYDHNYSLRPVSLPLDPCPGV
ncbi:MAG: hypothetical protein P8Y07_10575 [Gemmatimonadales bacterium]